MTNQENQIQTTNYCARAIEDILRWIANLETLGATPISAQRARVVVDMLQRSVKFLLPNCAQIVDERSLRETHLELLHLPYPLVAFEAPWIKDEPVEERLNGFPQTTSTRRIALCWELDDGFEPFQGLNEIQESFPEGGVFVVPVYYLDDLRSWSIAPGGTFVPHESAISSDFQQTTASNIATQALIDAGRARGNEYRFRAEPFILLPELFNELVARAGGSVDRAFAQIGLDCGDEVTMAVQACSVLNCANVGTVDIEPSRALNAKRVAKGKLPLFTYKVLQISAERNAVGTLAGGTHTSPRMHLRRGHLRRLGGRTVWVRAAMVNAGSPDGVVMKDYQVGSGRP